ncbi:MAG: hypothetical protein UV73_C0007G0012 [Candidatus Gottesmanbacteria bacterium GW2011_GWA2_43_14]|uniref:Uncharacterized protein n=1 Tax=Candidatus Gottesmanbacteria bacterium GW2011_GWA2_43_14 TaxID=1618443 RepID=A0A0G1DIP8_9BACT|nr:MAG: hypothetical protein UV73_C0007G0012 [Candidatus Gottesmanbacteria bacterium GW2011_GWA2_43_14]
MAELPCDTNYYSVGVKDCGIQSTCCEQKCSSLSSETVCKSKNLGFACATDKNCNITGSNDTSGNPICNCTAPSTGPGDPGGPGGPGDPGDPGYPGGGTSCSAESNNNCKNHDEGTSCGTGGTCVADGEGSDGLPICVCQGKDPGDPGVPAPSATPVSALGPDRPNLCQGISIDKATIGPGESFTVTSFSKTPINRFWYQFYNMDNLFGPGNPKSVCVAEGGDVTGIVGNCPTGTHHLIFEDPDWAGMRTTGSRTISYEEIFGKLDARNGNLPVQKIQINAYFFQSPGGQLSVAEIGCVGHVSSSVTDDVPTPEPDITITPTPASEKLFCQTDFDCGCALDKETGKCTVENKEFLAGQCEDPDFCSGIGGNCSTKCIENECQLVCSDAEKFACENQGFKWEVFPNGCVDSCELAGDPKINCTQALTSGCDCGPNACWNGTTCVGNPNDPLEWYAPDGLKCTDKNFIKLYNDSLCLSPVGYLSGDTLSDREEETGCNEDGTGFCYKAGGVIVNEAITPKYLIRSGSEDCTPITDRDDIPATIFDRLFTCSFTSEPKGRITGEVSVSFEGAKPFRNIIVYLHDISAENYLTFHEQKAEDVKNNSKFRFNFSPLFYDKTYELYVKAYDRQGTAIDYIGVINEGSCGSYSCQSMPDGVINFKLVFPDPLVDASPAQINQRFNDMINRWINNQADPLEISRFIHRITRVPGLQKATCDPKIPGGCDLP